MAYRAWWLLLLISVCFLGCGKGAGGRVGIDGSVSYAGEPIKKGSISFRAADQALPEISGAIVDGKYQIPAQLGPKLDEYTVRVLGFRITKDPKAYVPSYLKDDPNAGTKAEQIVPKKYNDASQLKVKFTSGKSTYDFNLEK